jgi:hypothetical protein
MGGESRMKVRITPHPSYIHGHIEKTLSFLGVTPPPPTPDGTVEVELSPLQLDQFRLKGSAHQIEIIPDAPPVPAGPPPGMRLVHEPPTVEEIESLIGCSREVAERWHWRNEQRAAGKTQEEIEQLELEKLNTEKNK